MKNAVYQGLKYYSSIISRSLSLFLAAGLAAAFFSERGWFPDAGAYVFSQMLYDVVIPVFMGYTAGKKCGGETGGLAGTLAASAVAMTDPVSAVLGAVLAGSGAGYFCKWVKKKSKEQIPAGFEMLAENMIPVICGCISGFLVYRLALPVLKGGGTILYDIIGFLIEKELLPLVSIAVEPLKILFLNNWANHGFFIPLGLEQVRDSGSSVLFLLETNPGPGFGILAAWAFSHKVEKREAVSSMAIHLLGGIHEVYFPYVLADLRLLEALIAGGIAGNFCFLLTGSGLSGPVSPGSILTILMMGNKKYWPGIIVGVAVSAAVSGVLAAFLMRMKSKRDLKPELQMEKGGLNTEKREETGKGIDKNAQTEDKEPCMTEENKKKIRKICFVCDAGMGSSAMSAALLRRRLKSLGIFWVETAHAPADGIPEDADVIVCQESFARRLPKLNQEVFKVGNLTDVSGYEPLIERIKGEQ